MSDAKNDNEQLQGEDLGPCPFCGKSIAYGISPVNGAPDSLLHELPTCPKFDEMDIDDFAKAMREDMERKAKT